MNLDQELKKLGLKRHHPVGKRVGSKVYFHASYNDEFFTCPVELEHYNITRLDLKAREVCFMLCPNFDTEDEPVITEVWNVTRDLYTSYDGNPFIYHHKWMFVKDDYEGFDVEAAKRRSLKWFPKAKGNRQVLSRIGRQRFWKEWLNKESLVPEPT